MKTITKMNILFVVLAMMLLTSCHTVQGAFVGAGQDTKSAANALHLNDNNSH